MGTTNRRIEVRATALPGRVCGPHQAVEVGVQIGREVHELVPADAAGATWTLEVERKPDGDWRGPAVHGKRGERFLYLVWREGTAHGPVMFRRAKLQLDAIPDEVADAPVVVAELGLTDRFGMPLCASVRPPLIRWTRE